MTVNFLEYPLDNGYIQNWLVAGPQVIQLHDLTDGDNKDADLKSKAQHLYHLSASAVSSMPIDRETFTVGDGNLTWQYTRCHEDHFIDVSGVYSHPVYLRTWAYAQIKLKDANPLPVSLAMTTCGMADVYLNGSLVHRKESWDNDLNTVQFPVQLGKENELLIQFDGSASRECFNVLAVHVTGLPTKETAQSISILIPSNVRFPNRQQQFERVLEKAYLEEVVNTRGAKFNLRWAEDLSEQLRYAYQVQDMKGSIYVEGTWDSGDHNPLDIGHGYRLYERPFQVVLKAPGKEYFEHDLRYQRSLPLHVLDNVFSDYPYATYGERRQEALEDALKHETDIFSEIATLELEKWSELNTTLITDTIERVRQVDNSSPSLLLGLLMIASRFIPKVEFPEKLKQPLEECIVSFGYDLSFRYGGPGNPDYSESETILLLTCEIMAGQLYPDRPFQDSKTGQWHGQQAGEKAMAWLRQRGQYGFMEWNSNLTFETDLLALSQLASLPETTEVSELAAVLLDKMLFSLAVNSYKGVFGVSHGRTDSTMIKSAQLEATSGLSRLLWGMGVFNHHILGTVGLACSNYEFPTFLTDIAVNLPEELLSKEHHAAGADPEADGVNLVTYKTPDYMLSSAQDYHPGQKGGTQHIAQATFGPDAVVFTNHPTRMSEHPGNLPGFWLGNGSLPRAAQWKDMLLVIYHLPEDDWMGFTHTYFPIYAFDEYSFKGNWAFARKGDGYLAITAAQPVERIWRGPDAYRELRSFGRQNTWLIQMGRRSLDGGFGDFRLKVIKTRPNWGDDQVNFRSLRGNELAFGWEGPLKVDGKEQPITGFKHIENPYCAAELPARQMSIGLGENLMRLTFE